MASNQDFIFTLGADISQFTKSITEVERELKDVRNSLKNQTGKAIAETNKYIEQLEGSLVDLNKVGFQNLNKNATGGTAALFSLSQVARDLPFGFIAIQNNLPIVIDQFTALSKTSGGLKNAFGQVLNSISGPAGFAFAFGALTSITTALVQEYGSLNNALGQIFGYINKTTIANEELVKTQSKAKGEAYAEAQSIDNLLGILKNGQSTYNQRLGAYNKLNEIIPDVLAGFEKEKIINGEQIQQLGRLVDLKKQNIVLDATRQSVIELIGKYTGEALLQITKLGKTNTFEDISNQLKGMLKGFNPVLAGFMQQISVLEENSDAVDNLNKVLDGLDAQIAKNTGEIDANTESYKDNKKATEDLNKEKEKQAKLEQKRIDDRNKELQLLRFQAFQENGIAALRDTANKNYKEYLDKKKEEKTLNDKIYGFQADAIEGFKNIKVPTIKDVIKPEILKSYSDNLEKLKNQFESIRGIVEQAISAPLDYLFNTVLEQGKFSWKEFGNVIIRTLAGVLASVIATTAAIAVANVITGGAYGATVKLADKATGGAQGIGGRPTLGYTPRGLRPVANFGGVGPGGLSMSGAVSLSLRGSDLVGAINRTNTNINRIG
jgi:hypothetical protein